MTAAGPAGSRDNAAPERRVIQRGLYFEEFEEDVVYVHSPGRTVSEADNILFCALTMNTQSLHVDAEWAKSTEFGERLINSMFTVSALVGTSVAQLTQGTVVANLGLTDVRFPNPMRAGDTMRSETRLISKRLSQSRAGQGIVELEHIGRNQRGEILVIATRATLVLCSPGIELG